MAKRRITLGMNHITLATHRFQPDIIALQLARVALQPVIAALQANNGPFQSGNAPLQACNDRKTTSNVRKKNTDKYIMGYTTSFCLAKRLCGCFLTGNHRFAH
jgi:hypothetical protein